MTQDRQNLYLNATFTDMTNLEAAIAGGFGPFLNNAPLWVTLDEGRLIYSLVPAEGFAKAAFNPDYLWKAEAQVLFNEAVEAVGDWREAENAKLAQQVAVAPTPVVCDAPTKLTGDPVLDAIASAAVVPSGATPSRYRRPSDKLYDGDNAIAKALAGRMKVLAVGEAIAFDYEAVQLTPRVNSQLKRARYYFQRAKSFLPKTSKFRSVTPGGGGTVLYIRRVS